MTKYKTNEFGEIVAPEDPNASAKRERAHMSEGQIAFDDMLRDLKRGDFKSVRDALDNQVRNQRPAKKPTHNPGFLRRVK